MIKTGALTVGAPHGTVTVTVLEGQAGAEVLAVLVIRKEGQYLSRSGFGRS
jgi:hypothetical protein